VRHQSQRGGLPGMEEVVFRQERTRSRLPHRSADLNWAAIVCANVPGSGSDPQGAHFVWCGPCVPCFPIQSGPPRFAPYPGCNWTWPFLPLTSTLLRGSPWDHPFSSPSEPIQPQPRRRLPDPAPMRAAPRKRAPANWRRPPTPMWRASSCAG
jgi:hypothetical protein